MKRILGGALLARRAALYLIIERLSACAGLLFLPVYPALHARDSLKLIQATKLHLHLEKSSGAFLARDSPAIQL